MSLCSVKFLQFQPEDQQKFFKAYSSTRLTSLSLCLGSQPLPEGRKSLLSGYVRIPAGKQCTRCRLEWLAGYTVKLHVHMCVWCRGHTYLFCRSLMSRKLALLVLISLFLQSQQNFCNTPLGTLSPNTVKVNILTVIIMVITEWGVKVLDQGLHTGQLAAQANRHVLMFAYKKTPKHLTL